MTPTVIDSIESLRHHLQVALRVEQATIPPYLCALYSIPDGANREASDVIRSVVMEEMLHMTLVANLLNAVGGTPVIADPSFPLEYPGYLPHSSRAFQVQLAPFSESALETFLRIERPAESDAPPEPREWQTLGQFYKAVSDGLEYLVETLGPDAVFTGSASRQVPSGRWYYGGGGDSIAVDSLTTARQAIGEVVEQGEGFSGKVGDGDDEPAHYFRFAELKAARRYRLDDDPDKPPTGEEIPIDWSRVSPMKANPKARDYVDRPGIHGMMVRFNQTYTRLLRQLQIAFTGTPDALFQAAPLMYELRYQAQALMRVPTGDPDGTTVGPSFEFDPDTPFT